MKKLILASAIAAITAGTANAATVYEGNGLTYKVNGDLQVQLRKDVGNDQNLDVEFDDLELKNSVAYDLGNDLKAFAQLDFGFKDAAEDKQSGSKLEEAYIGLKYGATSVAVGKMDFASDWFGVEKAYELKSDEDQFDAQGTDGDDVIRVTAELESLTLVTSYEIDAEGEDSASGEYFDLYVGTEIADLELAAAYQSKKATPASASEDTWGVSAAYDAGIVKLAADYSSSDLNTHDVDLYNLAAAFPIASTTSVAIGMVNTDDESKSKDVTEWYANVTYKFPTQKNVSLFAEIADTDANNIDLGYLAGMRIKF